jgi:hypothetical protein
MLRLVLTVALASSVLCQQDNERSFGGPPQGQGQGPFSRGPPNFGGRPNFGGPPDFGGQPPFGGRLPFGRPDDQEQEQGPPPKPFQELAKLCGAEDITPESCTCKDGTNFPTEQSDFGKCKPTTCTCPGNNEIIILKMFGCANGGMAE